jgi:hypothetical protein
MFKLIKLCILLKLIISPSFSPYRNEYYNALVIRHMSHICCLLDVVFMMLNEGSHLQFEMTGGPCYIVTILDDCRRGLDCEWIYWPLVHTTRNYK